MKLFLLATVGGGIGAGARYLIQTEMVRRLGPGFPWWTLAINVVGCLLMGIVADLVVRGLLLGQGHVRGVGHGAVGLGCRRGFGHGFGAA